MRIAGGDLSLTSTHRFAASRERSERLETWVGQRPARTPDASARMPAASPPTMRADGPPRGAVSLDDLARTLARQARARPAPPPAAAQSTPAGAADEPAMDAETRKVLLLLEKLFGIKGLKAVSLRIDTTSVAAVEQAVAARQGTAPQGWGLAYDYQETYREYEALSFSARGTVQTADGRSLSFSLDLLHERSYERTTSVSVRAGDAQQLQDPLMLALTGPVRLSPTARMQVDLDGDGAAEDVARPEAGSFLLVRDRDGDGAVDGPDELFGARSGAGFRELAALDDDGNGWLDEGDAAWGDLRLWDGAGHLALLAEWRIGALGLTAVDAAFAHTDAANTLLGQGRQASLYLTEDGRAGAVQQVDLVA